MKFVSQTIAMQIINLHGSCALRQTTGGIVVCSGRRRPALVFYSRDSHVRSEMDRVVDPGAVVGLCSSTEANFGDGVFPAETFLEAGGKISIGSDSHVSVCPFSELRLLEYGQRLTTNRRAVLCADDESCGRYLYRQAVEGGAQAMGQGGPAGLTVGGRGIWF